MKSSAIDEVISLSLAIDEVVSFIWDVVLSWAGPHAGRGQGFVIDAFETVLRMHPPQMLPRDAGNTSRPGNGWCADAAACMEVLSS